MFKPTRTEFPNPISLYVAAFRKEPWYKWLILIPLSPLVLLLVAAVEAVWLLMKWNERREQRRWDALPLEEQQRRIDLEESIQARLRNQRALRSAQQNSAPE